MNNNLNNMSKIAEQMLLLGADYYEWVKINNPKYQIITKNELMSLTYWYVETKHGFQAVAAMNPNYSQEKINQEFLLSISWMLRSIVHVLCVTTMRNKKQWLTVPTEQRLEASSLIRQVIPIRESIFNTYTEIIPDITKKFLLKRYKTLSPSDLHQQLSEDMSFAIDFLTK